MRLPKSQLCFFMFAATSLFGGKVSATTLERQIEHAIKNERYDHLGRLVKHSVDKKISLAKLQSLAKRKNSDPLLHAVQATRKINLKKTGLGISKGQFLQSALYIEEKGKKLFAHKKGYLKSHKTGLKHTLEVDPKLKTAFIVFDSKRAFLGEGKKKQVTKAIHYSRKRPQVVARAEQASASKREMSITKKLHGSQGLFKTLGFATHNKGSKKYSTIYARLYKPGSLETFFEKKYKLSLYEKMKVALDILCGLEKIHSLKIVHRDLGARNYLIHVPSGKPGKRKVEACVADLGRADYIKNVKDSKVQGNTTYTAPEGLFRSKLARHDYLATDLFATGCVLYRLFYGEKAPWQLVHYVKDTHRPIKKRYVEMSDSIRKATWHRRHYLGSKTKLSPKEQFEHLILKMLHVEPSKRGTAKEQRQKLEKIFARVGGKSSNK